MAVETASFPALMQRACHRDPEAQARLIRRYGPIILRVIRRHLHPELRRLFDSIDLQQEVWHSFFHHLTLSAGLETPEALARYLNAMTRHHLVDVFRKWLRTARRDLGRECPGDLTGWEHPQMGGQEPSGSQLAVAAEAWERLAVRFPPHYVQVVELRTAGHTQEEIAARLDLSERTVRRVLDSVQQYLQADAQE